MLRIVDGFVYEGKPSPDRWKLHVREMGDGHVEAALSRCIDWVESNELPAGWELSDRDLAEKHEANKRRAARRARCRIRRLVKSMGLDAMLTLTYRENQVDEGLCRRHLAEFVRRVRRLVPGFAYVAVLERQKRGAWHVHLAVHRLPVVVAHAGVRVKSYSVVRALWRGVVGGLGGNIDHKARRRRSKWSPGKLAGYLAKYLGKGFEDRPGANRYSASAHQLPDGVSLELRGQHLRDLIPMVYDLVVTGPQRVGCAVVSAFGDFFYLSSQAERSG